MFWRLVLAAPEAPALFSISDLRLVDRELYKNLLQLRDLEESELSALEIFFTLSGYDDLELCEGGAAKKVDSKASLETYISLTATTIFWTAIKEQVLAFRSALLTLHPVESLRCWGEKELSHLIVGASTHEDDFWNMEVLERYNF